ncbi:MAG: Crp/Fnr family transcriptional regulator [Gammaproteobacteria bacterium]|jgi:CRP/FNR family cyclic AMP-dependent transcriptional regulator|nr:Crp/Fnr family transcriptional regulator [Gammaproteobacteria bacterium]
MSVDFQNVPLFSDLTADEMEALSQRGVSRSFRKNTVIISEGDQTTSFFIIASGQVRVFLTSPEGKEVILNTLGPGDCFGELSLLDDAPRSASIVTTGPAVLHEVSRADFNTFIASQPLASMRLMRAMARRIRDLSESVRTLALLDVYGRVRRTLLELGEEQDGRLVIEPRPTHQDIANRVGASREMVTRILRDLSTGDYIETEDKRILILRQLPSSW